LPILIATVFVEMIATGVVRMTRLVAPLARSPSWQRDLAADLDRIGICLALSQLIPRSVGGRLGTEVTRHEADDPVGLGLQSQVRYALEPARDERFAKLRLVRDPQDRLDE
jgi:hypothetical protein